MAGVSAGKEKASEMIEGFHGSSQSLLADERKGVGVVNDNKTESIGLRMNALTEIVHLVANRMNTAVLFGAEPEDRFNRKGRLFFQDFYDIFKEGCLSRAWRSRNKDMGEVCHHFAYRCENAILAIETTH